VGIDGLMSILIFVLSLILLIAAAASGYASIDLLPTSTGVLYALGGAVAASAAVITFAIAVLVRRIDRLLKLVGQPDASSIFRPGFGVTPSTETAQASELSAAPLAVEGDGFENAEEGPAVEEESPININRSGHLPSLETMETVLETPDEPQGPPSIIGSYSSAGANYKIFSDGSIEAETSEGTFRFASMADFKRHLLETKAGTASATE
jgi:hypothetical protein